MRTSLALAILAGSLGGLFLLGCGGNTVGGGAGSTGCAALGATKSETSTSCPNQCAPTNAAYCAKNGFKSSCSGGAVDACGVSLPLPDKKGTNVVELKRSADVQEFAGNGPVDLSCFVPGTFPPPPDTAGSKPAKLIGLAKIFSHGCESKDLTIEIHKVVRSTGTDDGNPGEIVGAAVTTPSKCDATNSTPKENKDCTGGSRFECKFEYADVPTETELMVITKGKGWGPIYEYGLFVRNTDVKDGVFDKDVRALAQDDYNTIAQVAIGHPLTPGQGAIAGEVHDCGNVRLSGAIVNIDQPKLALSYFSENEANPLPDLSAKSTSKLGLYAAFEIAPGPVTLASAGVLDGKLVSTGYFRARVFKDAVTTLTFRGLRPFQLPPK